MDHKKERRAQGPTTCLQHIPDKFEPLVGLIRAIGGSWVAQATDYSEQMVSNYVTGLRGSHRLEKAIKMNLKKALDMKLEHQRKQGDQLTQEIENVLQKINENSSEKLGEVQQNTSKKPSTRRQTALIGM